MRSVRFKLITVFCLAALMLTTGASAQRPEPKKTEIQGHTMYTLMEPGGIPAIFEPEFTSISDAEKNYYPDEPLMVVSHKGETKAYSTWHLDQHEIVNDRIGGELIAATW